MSRAIEISAVLSLVASVALIACGDSDADGDGGSGGSGTTTTGATSTKATSTGSGPPAESCIQPG
ncbi:MAG: hypothetical protein HOV80_17370, partial [Polyangiaceae bacterium]|nr:hypothetical protein [Polyangiaceae bacterium]